MDLLKALMILFLAAGVRGSNVVMVLVDDLDLTLDGMQPLQNTQNLIGGQGATYENCFVASPICCPNRASILTGRYQHNHHTVNNSISGGCSSQQWQRNSERQTFATILKAKMEYTTFYAGKYLNEYGSAQARGPRYVPPGWDWWYGLVGNSKYYNYVLSINGTPKSYGETPNEYLTDVIKQASVTFINTRTPNSGSFLMVLAPPAPHEPWTPAARHNDRYKGQKAKRTRNFNTHSQDKHWLARMGPSPLPPSVLPALDDIYRRRWETLLAVDDLVMALYGALKSRNLLDDTYVIFTSDNGYHIGQFSMPMDKRQPYETDIRVPLLIRGPGIPPGSRVQAPVSSVDLFSTILEMGGTEATSDGTSMLSKNISDDRSVLIEYRGERSVGTANSGCPSDDGDANLSHCSKNFGCKCQDVTNNTYACVRRFSKDNNNVFCIFEDDSKYIEAYDLNNDPFQMDNIGYTMKSNKRRRFRKRLKDMVACEGSNCVRVRLMGSH